MIRIQSSNSRSWVMKTSMVNVFGSGHPDAMAIALSTESQKKTIKKNYGTICSIRHIHVMRKLHSEDGKMVVAVWDTVQNYKIIPNPASLK